MFFDATDLCRRNTGDGLCTQAAKSGKEVAFVVAGKEHYNNVNFMRPGWSSLNGISQQIDRFIELDNVKNNLKQLKND